MLPALGFRLGTGSASCNAEIKAAAYPEGKPWGCLMLLPDIVDPRLIAAIVVLLVLAPIVWRVLKRVGALLFVRAAVRAGLSDIGRKALEKQPDTIHLERVTNPEWKDAAAMEALARPLRTKGFGDCGVYSVDKMPRVKVWILFQEQTWVAAHLYEHPKAGIWPELVTRYRNGSSCSITTRPATGIQMPGWITIIRSPEAPTDQLYDRLLRERNADGIEHVTSGDAARAFEAAYARQMIAMKNKGISPEEVAVVAKKWLEKKAAGG